MKLDYATLISPSPLALEQIGNVKSPTLKEIFSPDITYQGYNLFLSLLLMTPQIYFEKVNPSKFSWYQNLSDDRKDYINMFDVISSDLGLQNSYAKMFNFFFVENVIWNKENRIFITYTDKDKHQNIIPTGIIHRSQFVDLCDIILQRCGIKRSDTSVDTSKVTNRRALEILKKIQKGRQNMTKESSGNSDMELPNLITAVAVKSNSINFINIWDLTVYQLYEQFRREQYNVYFDIQKMSVAAYGNKDKSFKGNEWYKSDT